MFIFDDDWEIHKVFIDAAIDWMENCDEMTYEECEICTMLKELSSYNPNDRMQE